ncbi:hypothetical protein HMPREF9371_0004 [Neisseria shayeganii 871]|uniref:Uncharacterized protein n=1 Tax=Neisseria shayeganii 871 TaxID=1032488 RepID=G4CEG5_9NEIS|nr:hypothetical protein HMPREF9371_0004 [Neisseria shayeganii 871]
MFEILQKFRQIRPTVNLKIFKNQQYSQMLFSKIQISFLLRTNLSS